jgi:hypothetical protein
LRKIALQKYRVEEKRLWAVEPFDIRTPFTTTKKLTTVPRMWKESLLPLAAEEADDFFGEVARLLNRVEKERRWATVITR